jgi:hypothetical protein
VPANHKRYGRIEALRRIVEILGGGLDLAPMVPDSKVVAAARETMDLEPELLASLRGRTE